MKNKLKVLISSEEIQSRLTELAVEIDKDYENKTITMVCVLKGGVIFLVDLAKKIETDLTMDFMDVSSYGDESESSGIVKITKDLDQSIMGKDVLVIEDIIDSGRTLSHLFKHLANQKPNSLKLCTLLDKPDRRVVDDIKVDYTGFVIPDKFVIGYGLDYKQLYRNLNFIGVVEQD